MTSTNKLERVPPCHPWATQNIQDGIKDGYQIMCFAITAVFCLKYVETDHLLWCGHNLGY